MKIIYMQVTISIYNLHPNNIFLLEEFKKLHVKYLNDQNSSYNQSLYILYCKLKNEH